MIVRVSFGDDSQWLASFTDCLGGFPRRVRDDGLLRFFPCVPVSVDEFHVPKPLGVAKDYVVTVLAVMSRHFLPLPAMPGNLI